jgi:hypothetical protein
MSFYDELREPMWEENDPPLTADWVCEIIGQRWGNEQVYVPTSVRVHVDKK